MQIYRYFLFVQKKFVAQV